MKTRTIVMLALTLIFSGIILVAWFTQPELTEMQLLQEYCVLFVAAAFFAIGALFFHAK